MSGYFILVGTTPVEVEDVLEWAGSFKMDNRRVAIDEVENVRISTVFLGLDHSFGRGVPLLFETMVFGGIYDEQQERYPTWELAETGHYKWVKRVRQSIASRAK